VKRRGKPLSINQGSGPANRGPASRRRGDRADTAYLFGSPVQVRQTTSPLVLLRNSAAVVDDIDAKIIGDRYPDVQMLGTGVTDSIADRLSDDRLGMLGQMRIHRSHWSRHVQRGDDLTIFGQARDGLLNFTAEAAGIGGR